MPITDVQQARVVELLAKDMLATIGSGHDHIALDNASRLRQFIEDASTYIESVVEATQQDIHDDFIDTAWPRCPRHMHPLWFRDGSWWCERDGLRVAPLGGLDTNNAA